MCRTAGARASRRSSTRPRPDQRGAIDRALGHIGGGAEAELKINAKVEGAYNRSQHLAPRRALFDAWAVILVDGAADATLG